MKIYLLAVFAANLFWFFFLIQQNPLTSKSDRHLFSHKNITAELNAKVIREKILCVKKIILVSTKWNV